MNAHAIPSFLAASIAMLAPAHAQNADKAFVDTPGKHLDLVVDGKPALRYMYAYDTSDKESAFLTYKTYFHVFAPDGESFLTKATGQPYPHHRGIFTGWSRLGHGGKKYDLWHMKSGAAQVHQEFVERKNTDSALEFATKIHWILPDKTVALEEKRGVTVHKDSGGALLLADFTCHATATNGDVALNGDPEHAGFQFRAHEEVGKNKSAKYTFPTEKPDLKKDLDIDWAANTYELGGKKYTVQMMRAKENPKGSVWSAYRDYGRFGNFWTGTVKDGDSLSWTYRIRITEGEAPPREEMQKHFEAWQK